MTKRPLWLAVPLVLMCLSVPTPGAAAANETSTASARGSSSTLGSTLDTLGSTLGTGDFETRLFLRTNKRRAAHGCRPLRLDPALQVAARQHSVVMSSESELSHRLADEAGLVERAVSAGYTPWRLLAENLAWGQSTPGEVFRDWVHSAGHRENLDNCHLRDVGVGVVLRGGRPWVTADFGRRTR